MMRMRVFAVIAVLMSFAGGASGKVSLPNIFGDHMVVQCGKPVAVWGWADAGEKIAVVFKDQTRTATAAENGEWSVKFDAMEASFEPAKIVVEGKGTRIEIADVLIGEVWLCGGQSNMEWSLRSSRDADVEMDSADYPAMRFIKLPHTARLKPQKDFPVDESNKAQGFWRLCTAEQLENCTAVGYYFARRLHRRLKVPVGLIDASWGGTMAQHWVSKDTLRKFNETKPHFESFETSYNEWVAAGAEEGARKRYDADMKEWEKKIAAAKAKGDREPRRPNINSYGDPSHGRHPGGMFDGMIMPLSKMAIRGVLFYQGENNSFGESWKPFSKTFPAVISDWRKAFGDTELPFGIIQIAGWSTRRTMQYDMNHHTNIVREIQFNTWRRTPNTGLIATYDTNSNRSIHPGKKLPVGERSARWALAEVYKQNAWRSNKAVEWRGPVYESMQVNGEKIVISFLENTGRGLVLDQDDDCGFYIAGKDKVFHDANARVIAGDKLEVWNDEVPEPVAVRYASSNLPVGRLLNSRELPAYPFRTDNWPLTPHQSTGSWLVDDN